MRITADIPDHAACIELVLEGFVQCACLLLASGCTPLFPHDAGVRYQMEPAGAEDWALPHKVLGQGWGDCEDLAIWTAAGLRITHEDDDARVIVVRTGPGKLHAVVQRGDGTIEDPSYDLHDGGNRANLYQVQPQR